jgi:hypothetical protein
MPVGYSGQIAMGGSNGAHRPIVMHELCKQQPFLGNGLVNTFPQQQIHNSGVTVGNGVFSKWPMLRPFLWNSLYSTRGVVFSVWSMSRSYLEDNWGNSVQFCMGACEEKLAVRVQL